jgi:hypothetical protein
MTIKSGLYSSPPCFEYQMTDGSSSAGMASSPRCVRMIVRSSEGYVR